MPLQMIRLWARIGNDLLQAAGMGCAAMALKLGGLQIPMRLSG
jgi:hypothetical protein